MRLRSLLALVVLSVGLLGHACGSSDAEDEDACFHRGQVRPVGSEFPAGDGCNTCTCNGDLSVSCTEVPCPDADLPDASVPDGDAGDGGADAGELDAG